jgi:hypothetical protein
VIVSAVAELLAIDGATLASVAKHWECHPRTLGRWMAWISCLVEVAVLFKACWLHDPSGMPPPVYKPRRKDLDSSRPEMGSWKARAVLVGSLVLLFAWLARLHRDKGIPLEEGPGLGAILRRQFDLYRLVSLLTKSSPGMQIDVLWTGG